MVFWLTAFESLVHCSQKESTRKVVILPQLIHDGLEIADEETGAFWGDLLAQDVHIFDPTASTAPLQTSHRLRSVVLEVNVIVFVACIGVGC